MALYDKLIKHLFRDMIKDLGIQKGDILERSTINSWFKTNYPLVKPSTVSAHMLKMSINAPSRVHYNVDSSGEDDLLLACSEIEIIDPYEYRLSVTLDKI